MSYEIYIVLYYFDDGTVIPLLNGDDLARFSDINKARTAARQNLAGDVSFWDTVPLDAARRILRNASQVPVASGR